MNKDDFILESDKKWALDLTWLAANNRSLSTLAGGSLCPKCRKKLKFERGAVTDAEVLKAAKSCCSKHADFITPTLPLQESAFRVFLANGNEPLSLDELGKQLNERRGIDAYRTSPSILSRLFTRDQHYGIRQIAD